MDCMLQVNILAVDSRLLYLPTSIRRIRINTVQHLEAIAQLDPENPVMDVYMSKELGIVSCAGIEIEGLVCSSVSRRKAPGTEVLESYEFVPFNCDSIEYSQCDAASIFLQIGLENLMLQKLKVVEVDTTNGPEEPNTLIQYFNEAINNLPLITADAILLRKEKFEIDHVTIEDGELKAQTNCHFIIASNWLKNSTEQIAQAQESLLHKGYLVLREDKNILWNKIEPIEGFNLISLIKTPNEALVLLQRIQPEASKMATIAIDSKDITFDWLNPLKEAVKNGEQDSVVIAVEQNEYDSGLLGLINCMRREPGGNVIRCVQIDDKIAPDFDLSNPFYSDHLKLNLATNVYRNGQWGAYRHIALKKSMAEKSRTSHYFANVLRLGDLSSFEWMTGWINLTKSQNLVNIQYSAINFRDVMLATGRLPLETHHTSRLMQQCFLGLEYAGVTASGERLMGMVPYSAISTHTGCYTFFTFFC